MPPQWDAARELIEAIALGIRTPLAAAKELVALAEPGEPNTATQRYLELAHSRLDEIAVHLSLSELLVSLHSESLRFRRRPFILTELIEELHPILKRRTAARGRALTVELPDALPPLFGDRQWIAQALLGICFRRRDASRESGALAIVVRNNAPSPDLRIDIQTDLGTAPINAEDDSICFDLAQADASRSLPSTPEELASTACRDLIRLSLGSIEVSQSDQGPFVRVSLPKADPLVVIPRMITLMAQCRSDLTHVSLLRARVRSPRLSASFKLADVIESHLRRFDLVFAAEPDSCIVLAAGNSDDPFPLIRRLERQWEELRSSAPRAADRLALWPLGTWPVGELRSLLGHFAREWGPNIPGWTSATPGSAVPTPAPAPSGLHA